MASLAFPSLAKKATLPDGTTYGYVAVAPSSANKPTFLFLHGYPSSSYDWRRQIETLPTSGFGVIVPDLLGYGDTDAPEDLDSYRMKTIAHHMADILDREGVARCIAVGHDWGSTLLSRLVNYIPDRLIGVVFLALGYVEPGIVWDIDVFIKMSREVFGYDVYGYWPWHVSEESAKDCDDHPASVFSLLYPADPADWIKDFASVGKAAEFVKGGQLKPLPSWFNLAEYTVRDRIISMKGYGGPLNWYKAWVREVNSADEAGIPEERRYCKVPTLFVAAEEDFVTRADVQTENSKKWVKDLRIKTLSCGHWVQLEKPAELRGMLEEFAGEVAV
ncbi:putative microsomal epoxide hydrolase [Microsporum canis]|uniref:AB hydrolase-1 domain-containing protein n=1 Tax=Arthroderma otae (strain ATCC MYA-4605 / CBS 113480) TaxID=554155 RepID=C5FV97_ARTOC|nr:conserved hypothetical protein [Microsporum canis CBS 113480]EEQ33831.1 conserved hypothetical protein [Microsporum canis CBS 113480]